MHFDNIDAAIAEAAADALTEAPDARCVAGCYRCLLSYYNQPDHELIDRTDREVKTILLRLARSRVAASVPQSSKLRKTATGTRRWRVGGSQPGRSAAHHQWNNAAARLAHALGRCGDRIGGR